MTASIQPAEWLHYIKKEYLTAFIGDGGCAMKFAVPMDDKLRPEIFNGLAALGEQTGFLVVKINAAETKVHMIDEIFFRTAEQIPWGNLSRRVIAKLVAELGYSSVDSVDGPLYRQLAERNHIDSQLLLMEIKKSIWDKVFKHRKLSKDFRTAMTNLCYAELTGGQEGTTTIESLTEWLTGRNKALSTVKQFQIFRKINRATARYFFESLLHWVRLAGYPGIVVLLDAQRIMLARNPHDYGLFYSKAALMDAYEVLRQFIDAGDKLEGCFITVVPNLDFLEDHGRGLAAYEALKFRVFDEIRDKNLVNPMASLARIGEAIQG